MPNMGDVCGTCGKLFDLHRGMSPHNCPNPKYPTISPNPYDAVAQFTPQQTTTFKVGDLVTPNPAECPPEYWLEWQGKPMRVTRVSNNFLWTDELGGAWSFSRFVLVLDYSTSSSSPRVAPSMLHLDPISPDLAFFSRCTSPGACEKCAGPKPCSYHE